MFCPRCGKPIQPGAHFCMNCGQQLGQVPQVPQAPQIPQGQSRPAEQPRAVGPMGVAPIPVGAGRITRPAQNKWLWPLAIGLLLLLALLIGAAVFLKAAGHGVATNIRARASSAPVPIMAGKPTMPQDIYDWLDHLRQTEDQKLELTRKQESQLMIEFTKLNGLGGAYGSLDSNGNLDPDKLESPSTELGQKVGDFQGPWRDLIKFFESVPPPPECKDLGDTYDKALDETSGEMGDIVDMLNGSGNDPNALIQKLQSMEGRSSGNIDRAFTLSDEMVSQICDKYNTKKWFKISGDVSIPLSSGAGGGVLPGNLGGGG